MANVEIDQFDLRKNPISASETNNSITPKTDTQTPEQAKEGYMPLIAYNTNGERMGNVTYSNEAYANSLSGTNYTMFRGDDGRLSRTPTLKISVDDNGKAKLTVSKYLTENSDWYKNNFSDSSTFDVIARAYAEDPEGKSTLTRTLDDGTVEEVTVKELLEEYQKAADDFTSNYASVIQYRDAIKNGTAAGIVMSDSQIQKASHKLDKTRDKNSDTEVMYIPNIWKTQYDFSNLESWDEDSGTISARDWYKLWSVGTEGGLTDDQVQHFIDSLVQEVGRRNAILGDEENGWSEEMVDDYARSLSALSTITDSDGGVVKPDMTFGYQIKSAASAGMASFADVFENWTTGMTMIADYAGRAFYSGLEYTPVGFAFDTTEDLIELARTGEIDPSGVSLFSLLSLMGDYAEAAKTPNENTLNELVSKTGDFVEQAYKTGYLSSSAKEAWSRTASNIEDVTISQSDSLQQHISELKRISSGASVGAFVGAMAGNILIQIAFTNPAGSAAEGIVAAGITQNSVATGLKSILNSVSAKGAANLVKGLLKFGAWSAGKATNLAVQGVVDTVLSDGVLTAKILRGDSDGEIIDVIKKNIGLNLIGEVTGFGTSKGIGWFANNTFPGSVAQSAARNVSARVGHGIRSAGNTVASIFGNKNTTKLAKDFVDSLEDPTKVTAEAIEDAVKNGADYQRIFYELEQRARENVYKASNIGEDGSKSLVNWVENTKKAVNDRVKLEVEFSNISKGYAAKAQEILRNENVNAAYRVRLSNASKVVSLENGKGFKYAGGQFFTQESSDYLGQLVKNEYYTKKALAAAEPDAMFKMSKAEIAEWGIIKEQIASFEAKEGNEQLIAALKQYYESNKAFQYQLNQYALRNNLIDSDLYNDRAKTGFWGEDNSSYVHLYRFDGADTAAATTRMTKDLAEGNNFRAKTELDEYSYKPGDTETHYLDPELVNYSQVVALAKVSQARDWFQAINNVVPFTREIDMAGKPVTERQVASTRSAARKSGVETLESITNNKDIYTYDLYQSIKNFADPTKKAVKMETLINKKLRMNADSTTRAGVNELDLATVKEITSDMGLRDMSRPLRSNQELEELYDGLSAKGKQIVDQALKGKKRGIRAYNEALRNTGLGDQLSYRQLYDNSDVLKNSLFRERLTEIRTAKLDEKNLAILNKYYDKYADLTKLAAKKEVGVAAFNDNINAITEDIISVTKDSFGKNVFGKDMIEFCEKNGVDKELAARYFAIDTLVNGSGSERAIRNLFRKYYGDIQGAGNIPTNKQLQFTNMSYKALKENLESELNTSIRMLEESGGSAVIDTEYVYNYIYKQMNDIIASDVKPRNIVEVLDESGKYKLVEMSPLTAELYLQRPNFNAKNAGLSKFINKTNRIFRFFTTTVSLSSFVNQGFRDPLDSYIRSGFGLNNAFSNTTNKEFLSSFVGDKLADSLIDEMGREGAAGYAARMGFAGENAIKDAAAKYYGEDTSKVLYEGVAAPSETQAFRQAGKSYREAVYGDISPMNMKGWRRAVSDMKDSLLNFVEQYNPGNARELYLRRANYNNAFRNAIEQGETVQVARNWAQFTADNATTDFSRHFAWGNQITSSVPYLASAINGTSSFFRLWEIDPVGVSGRLIGGIMLPYASMLTQSLNDPANAKVYKNIPEYVKKENLIIVVDGQAHKIPFPQELGAFVAPIRQVIEKAYDVQDNSWTELIASDLLSISPVNIDGFVDLDRNPLLGDPTFKDRLSSLTDGVISQLMPPAVKTAYMAWTRRDPYTGDSIDYEYTYIDSEGNLQIVDSTDSSFATWVSEICRKLEIDVSPSMANALLKSFFGKTAVNLTNDIIDVFSGQPIKAGERLAGELTNPITVRAYNQEQSDFRDLVSTMEQEKYKLLQANGNLSKIASKMSQLDSNASDYQTKLKGLQAQYDSITQEYREKVLNGVKQFQQIYGDNSYDARRFASVLNLMTFNTPSVDARTDSEREESSAEFYNARQHAIRVMKDKGFTSASGTSIFGREVRNADGEVEFKQFTPLSILDMSAAAWGASDEHMASIENILKGKDLTTSERYKQYQSAKKQGKAALKKFKKEWNTKVVEAIAPYIYEHGVDSVLNNTATREMLDNYIYVDNVYKTKEYLYKIFGKESK